MLRRLSIALAASFACSGLVLAEPASRDPAKVPAGAYALDRSRASLVLTISELEGLSRLTVRFTGLDGSLVYAPMNWPATKVSITVDPKSIDTKAIGEAIAGYLEPDRYPVIQFKSTAFTTEADGRGRLTGDLTFHGVTRPVTLDVKFNGVDRGFSGAGARMGFSGASKIRRSEFGVTGGRPFASDVVDLVFDVAFVQKFLGSEDGTDGQRPPRLNSPGGLALSVMRRPR
jgi:polyisoprenoid-binding protein YceI